MFSSKNKAKPVETIAVPTMSPQPVKRAPRSSAPSIISADLTINGTLNSTGDVQIDGRVDGDVHTNGLVIGEKALINGEVFAEDVTVRGRVQGNIRARKVLLCSTCNVEGNILHEAFAVEAGAFFQGNCRHSDNPLADEVPRPAAPAPEYRAPAAPVSVIAPVPVASAPVMPRQEPVAAKPAGGANFAPLKSGV